MHSGPGCTVLFRIPASPSRHLTDSRSHVYDCQFCALCRRGAASQQQVHSCQGFMQGLNILPAHLLFHGIVHPFLVTLEGAAAPKRVRDAIDKFVMRPAPMSAYARKCFELRTYMCVHSCVDTCDHACVCTALWTHVSTDKAHLIPPYSADVSRPATSHLLSESVVMQQSQHERRTLMHCLCASSRTLACPLLSCVAPMTLHSRAVDACAAQIHLMHHCLSWPSPHSICSQHLATESRSCRSAQICSLFASNSPCGLGWERCPTRMCQHAAT